MTKTFARRFLRLVDNFYSEPDYARNVALGRQYTQPDGYVGWRTTAHHPRNIKARIERLFGIRISYWESDTNAIEVSNGVFFSSYSSGEQSEPVRIHYDDPPGWMMLLIYLTPNAPADAGTSFWQHRETGLTAKPTKRDASRLGVPLADLKNLLINDDSVPSRWLEIDRIGNVFNRGVMFPAGLLHSATRHFGSNTLDGRLFQSFHFPIDWP